MNKRIDVTEWRKGHVADWNVRTKGYKKLSTKALILLERLGNGEEMQRTDLFRAAGYKANPVDSGGFAWTDFTDYKLYNTGLIDMRATGVKGNWSGYNGVTTYWTINEKGLAALSASYLRRI